MNNLLANYERILEVLRKLSTDTLLIYKFRWPKLLFRTHKSCLNSWIYGYW